MKKSLVLLLITLAMAAYVYWYEIRTDSRRRSTDETQQLSATLVGAKKEEISGFTLRKGDQPPITVRRVREEWVLTAPVNASADIGAVNAILWDLEGAERHETIMPADLSPENIAAFGLDSPVGSISVSRIGGEKEFLIGGPDVQGARVYVREGADGPVHIVARSLAQKLDVTVFQLRNRNVVNLAPNQVSYIRIFGSNKAALEKHDNLWNLAEPLKDYADPQAVSAFLREIAAMTVVEFVTDEPADLASYGLDARDNFVTIAESAGLGGAVTVHFGAPAPPAADGRALVYAKRDDARTVFTVPADGVRRLFPALSDIQGRSLTRLDPFMLKKVTMTSGLAQVEFTRPEYDWRMTKPLDVDANSDAVNRVIDIFQKARVEQLVVAESDDRRYGFDLPQGSFSYLQADRAPIGIVFGADADENSVYVKRTDTPGVYRVSRSILDSLKVRPLDMRTLEMQKVNMMRVDALTLRRDDRAYVLVRARTEQGGVSWKLTEPVAANANQTMMTQVAAALATLRAHSLVEESPSDLAPYGLDIPAMRVEFQMPSGDPAPMPLLVGKPGDGGRRFAMLEGDGTVFMLDSALSAGLFDEPRDPRVMAFSVVDASRVEFVRGQARYVFLKSDGAWIVESPADLVAGQSTIARTLTQVASLQTPRFVSFATTQLARYGLDKPQAVVRVITPAGVAALSIGELAPSGHYYATSTLVDGIFLLTPGDHLANVLSPDRLVQNPVPVPAEN